MFKRLHFPFLYKLSERKLEGSGIQSVSLPESLTTIGDKAFANTSNLRLLYIPQSVSKIGQGILDGNRNTVIKGMPGSYARAWAKENGIPFAPLIAVYANNTPISVSGCLSARDGNKTVQTNQSIEEQEFTVSKGRAKGEIKAAKYEKYFAHSIQGRSPPVVG